MSYPSGYDARGLAPTIVIKDITGATKFTWEHKNVDPSPTQDFDLIGWQVEGGVNTFHGIATIIIDDRNQTLLDTTDLGRPLKIKNGWEMIIQLGKDQAGLETWFDGIIVEPELIQEQGTITKIQVSAIGFGIRTAHRKTRIRRYQKKTSDGLSLDATDTDVRISELFKDILVDTDHLAFPGLGQETITVNGVDLIDIKLPDLQRDFQSFGLVLNELANIAGALYGITPLKDAFLRLRGSTPSGFLITNKLNDIKTTGWPVAKLLISRQERFNYKESTIDSGYTIIHGTGAQHDVLDADQTTENALQDLNPSDVSFPFVAKFDNISKVALFLSKIGTIDKDLHVCVVDKGSGAGPNRTAIKQRINVPFARLEREVTTGGVYFEVAFNSKIPLEANSTYFILLGNYPDSGELRIDYQTGSGSYYLDDALQTGDMKFRTYHSKTMHIIGQNVVARQSLRDKEHVMNLRDFPNEETATIAMEGMLESLAKINRIYNPIICSAPDDYLDLGKTCDVIDGATGLEDTVDLMGFSIGGSALEGGNLGAENILVYVNKVYL